MEKNVSYLQRFKMMPHEATLLLFLYWIKSFPVSFSSLITLISPISLNGRKMKGLRYRAEQNNEIQTQVTFVSYAKNVIHNRSKRL